MGHGFQLQEKWDWVEEERVACASFRCDDGDVKECHGWGKGRDVG